MSSDTKKVSYFMGWISFVFYLMAVSATFYGNPSGIHACAFLICATIWHASNLVVSQTKRTTRHDMG